MGTPQGRWDRDGWRHKVTASGEGNDPPEIRVDDKRVRVILRNDEVVVGCTTVSRAVVNELYALFEKHFPKNCQQQVLVQ